jgi:predicted transcriptional regulator
VSYRSYCDLCHESYDSDNLMTCHILTLRLEPEIIEKLDGLVERMYQKQDLNVTRVDLIRQAIRQYVERETAEVS